MNYSFKLLGLGLLIVSGGALCSMPDQEAERAAQAVLLQELGLRYVDQAQVERESLVYERVVRVFSTVRVASLAVLVGSVGFNFWNWYSQVSGRSDRERITALEKLVLKPEPGKTETQGWISSVVSFSKGILTGVPTTLGSTLVSGAAVGLLTSTIPVSELAKPEPSYKWFLNYKTGFSNECGLLLLYVDRQAIHDAFCIEMTKLVSNIEKILGYVVYQVRKIKKSSSIAAKVLESRSKQLVIMTNQLVDLVAQKEYEKFAVSIQMLNAFVSDGLPAGILV